MTSSNTTQELPVEEPMRVRFTMAVSPSTNDVAAEKIIAWYLPFFGDFQLGTAPTMTYDKNKRLYEVTFIPSSEFPTNFKDQLFELEMFADPDDDGNYPIKIGKQKYLVIGELISLNNVTL